MTPGTEHPDRIDAAGAGGLSMVRHWRVNWIVTAAAAVHCLWGVVLLFTSVPLATTPMSEVPWNAHHLIAAGVYLLAGGTAMSTVFWRRLDEKWGMTLCMPQQLLLLASAYTAARCVVRGSYADGVERPWEFILCDQLWCIIGMLIHTASVIDWYGFATRGAPDDG